MNRTKWTKPFQITQLTCKCCPAAETTWMEVSHSCRCTPAGVLRGGGDKGAFEYVFKLGQTIKNEAPVDDLHNGVGPTWHVPWEQVSVCKLPMHQCSIQPCLCTNREKMHGLARTVNYITQKVQCSTHLVFQAIGGGLVVLRKVGEPVLCLVSTINDCAHGVRRSSRVGTPKVVHAPFNSNLHTSTAYMPEHTTHTQQVQRRVLT